MEGNWRKTLVITDKSSIVCIYLASFSPCIQKKPTNTNRSVLLSALCYQSAAVLPQKQSLCLIYTQQAGGHLLLFCLVSSRANSSPSSYVSLRFLWSPAGSCCLSSKCGPGSIFSTSSMLRHPGLAKTWVSRMLSGAYPLYTYEMSLGFWGNRKACSQRGPEPPQHIGLILLLLKNLVPVHWHPPSTV